jgi:hypothetical protein
MAKKKTLPCYADLSPNEQAKVLGHVEDHIRYAVRKGGPAGISDLAQWVCTNLDNEAIRTTLDYLAKRPPTK